MSREEKNNGRKLNLATAMMLAAVAPLLIAPATALADEAPEPVYAAPSGSVAAVPAAEMSTVGAMIGEFLVIDDGSETIADDMTPLGAFDHDDDIFCWTHWWMLLGIVLTSVYGLGVVARSQRCSNRLQSLDDAAMGIIGAETPTYSPTPSMAWEPVKS